MFSQRSLFDGLGSAWTGDGPDEGEITGTVLGRIQCKFVEDRRRIAVFKLQGVKGIAWFRMHGNFGSANCGDFVTAAHERTKFRRVRSGFLGQRTFESFVTSWTASL